MSAVTGYRSAEEAALDLELPLLATLPAASDEAGPIAPALPHDVDARREFQRAADRILLSPLTRAGSVGLVGDLPAFRRARLCGQLAAALASERAAILVDGDLRAAHLSFDEGGRAQEGLVDVLRYGVRSPRLVAPTLAPGLNLLPVGSDTVDYAGTFESQAILGLFDDLTRSGDLLVVNAPGPDDLAEAGSFVRHVSAWVLIHQVGHSDSTTTRNLRDWLGAECCVGLLAVAPPSPAGVTDQASPPSEAESAFELELDLEPADSGEPPAAPSSEMPRPTEMPADETLAPSAAEPPARPPTRLRFVTKPIDPAPSGSEPEAPPFGRGAPAAPERERDSGETRVPDLPGMILEPIPDPAAPNDVTAPLPRRSSSRISRERSRRSRRPSRRPIAPPSRRGSHRGRRLLDPSHRRTCSSLRSRGRSRR